LFAVLSLSCIFLVFFSSMNLYKLVCTYKSLCRAQKADIIQMSFLARVIIFLSRAYRYNTLQKARTWDIQNWASYRVGSGSTEAWFFCKFLGTSVGVGKILLWELAVRDKLQPRGPPQSICSGRCTTGRPPVKSALGPPFYEGIPKAGPGVWCSRLEDPQEMGMGQRPFPSLLTWW